MFRKKQPALNTGIFATNEQLEKHLETVLNFTLEDFGDHYEEIANLSKLKEENTLFYNHIKGLCFKKRYRFTDKPDSYIYTMKSDKFLFRKGSKIPKKDKRFAKLGYQVRKIVEEIKP